MLRRTAIPLQGFREILMSPLAMLIAVTHVIHGFKVSLARRFEIPTGRLGLIDWNPLTKAKYLSDFELSIGKAAARRCLIPANRLLLVGRTEGALLIKPREDELGAGISLLG